MQSSRSMVLGWVRRQVSNVRPSLRARLIYTLSCVVLVLLALAAAEHFDDRERRQNLLKDEQLRAAADAAAAFTSMLDQQFRVAETTGVIALSDRLGTGQVEPFLEEVHARHPGNSAIHVASRVGQRFSTAPALAGAFFDAPAGFPG